MSNQATELVEELAEVACSHAPLEPSFLQRPDLFLPSPSQLLCQSYRQSCSVSRHELVHVQPLRVELLLLVRLSVCRLRTSFSSSSGTSSSESSADSGSSTSSWSSSTSSSVSGRASRFAASFCFFSVILAVIRAAASASFLAARLTASCDRPPARFARDAATLRGVLLGAALRILRHAASWRFISASARGDSSGSGVISLFI